MLNSLKFCSQDLFPVKSKWYKSWQFLLEYGIYYTREVVVFSTGC